MARVKVIVNGVSLVCLALVILTQTANGAPSPDSAGIAPMINGLAYGNIPYGSVSGQLASYVPPHQRVAAPAYYNPHPNTITAYQTSVVHPVPGYRI